MTCPKCGFCEHCGRSTPSQFNRWQCAICGVWVTYGSVHTCPTTLGTQTVPGPYPAYPTFTSSFPSETLP